MEEKIIVGEFSGVAFTLIILKDILLCFIIIGIPLLIRDLVWFLTCKLTVTDRKIHGQSGWLHTEELDSPLNKIDGIKVEQGLFGKLFDYGAIKIVTPSTVFVYPYLKKPKEFKMLVNTRIDLYNTKN